MSSPSSSAVASETCPAELPNFCAQRHWSIFWILILCSVGTVAGRIVTLQHHSGQESTPFFSANDRSRWATIRALGDNGTYVLDPIIAAEEPIRWDSIDKVRHVGADGRMHYYSSKPPLLPTILAGGYRGLRWLTGWTLQRDTQAVVRGMLLVVNGGGWLLFLVLLALTINAIPVRDWARYYVLACAGFGTFLSTFAITLNNHLPAAIATMAAIWATARLYRRESCSSWVYAIAGFSAATAVANEMPALALAACLTLLVAWKSWSRTLVAFLPAAAVVAIAFLGTNYLAHGTWQLAYAHRSDGPAMAKVAGDFDDALDAGQLPVELDKIVEDQFQSRAPLVEPGSWPDTPEGTRRWIVRDAIDPVQLAITRQAGASDYQLHRWNNWYDYPGSYWLARNDDRKSDVDRGEGSIAVYGFHLTVGHHGIFSLTPIWLLAWAGMIALAGGAKLAGRFTMRWLGWTALAVSLVVIAFYLRRPEMDRNYGGVTSGLRWVFWLAPVWLVSMLPVVDWLGSSRMGKAVCYLLLLASIVSAAYSATNPWVHPWLYEVWDLTGLPK